MEWQDQGILLSTKRLGENSLLATFLTAQNGKQTGLFKSIDSPHYFTPLAHLMQLHWQGRSPEQLGQMKAEPIEAFTNTSPHYSVYILKNALLSLLHSFVLPHDPQPQLFNETKNYLQKKATQTEAQIHDYLLWEMTFLKTLGFGGESFDTQAPVEILAEEVTAQLDLMATHLNRLIPKARMDLMGSLKSHEAMTA